MGRFGGEGWLAGLLTLIPVTLAGLSLLTASNGNITVFKTLVTTLSVPAILITSYVTALPVFIPIAFAIHAFVTSRTDWPINSRSDRLVMSLWGPFIVVNILIIPHGILEWVPISIASAFGMTFTAITPFLREKRQRGAQVRLLRIGNRRLARIAKEALRDIPLAAAALLVIEMVILNGMWLPSEVIAIKGQSPVSTGYVLQEKENQLLIYWADDRGVQRYRADQVEYRQICEMKHRKTYSLLRSPSPRPRQQSCPPPNRR
ncbi:hypothetical protein [Micromonospora sp. WMMB235]|uniref:hypothetical protein n=1 Tax=Micromonospora sp. WMMB235 TaxID=1172030 RepID=UPI00115FC064|nr:hypothetical protein [Micromonospora sp. WMMB235]